MEGRWSCFEQQSLISTAELADLFWVTVRSGLAAVVPKSIAILFGVAESCTARELWGQVLHSLTASPINFDSSLAPRLHQYLRCGSLSERILHALAGDFRRENLAIVYGELCECLSEGTFFRLEEVA